jgi:hypothetical protein
MMVMDSIDGRTTLEEVSTREGESILPQGIYESSARMPFILSTNLSFNLPCEQSGSTMSSEKHPGSGSRLTCVPKQAMDLS